jgi:hypothetical protein
MRYYLYGKGSVRTVTMLPPIIIEHIKKREEEERRRQQPFIQLPVPGPLAPPPRPPSDEGSERGVVIIDIT